MGVRNLKFIEKENVLFVIPYDFDFTSLLSPYDSFIIDKKEFESTLKIIRETLKNDFSGFLIDELKEEKAEFVEKIKKILLQENDLPFKFKENEKQSIQNFVEALNTIEFD